MDLLVPCIVEGRSELRNYQSCELQDTLATLFVAAEHLTHWTYISLSRYISFYYMIRHIRRLQRARLRVLYLHIHTHTHIYSLSMMVWEKYIHNIHVSYYQCNLVLLETTKLYTVYFTIYGENIHLTANILSHIRVYILYYIHHTHVSQSHRDHVEKQTVSQSCTFCHAVKIYWYARIYYIFIWVSHTYTHKAHQLE